MEAKLVKQLVILKPITLLKIPLLKKFFLGFMFVTESFQTNSNTDEQHQRKIAHDIPAGRFMG